MLRLISSAAVVALQLLTTAAVSAEPELEKTYTLAESRRLALLNNADLLSAEQDIVISEQRVQETRFLFFPEFGLQASWSRYNARYPFALAPEYRSVLLFPSDIDNIYSGRGYVRQPLYEGGRTVNLLKLAQTGLKQAQTRYDAVKLELRHNTERVFYRLVLAQENHAAPASRLAAAEALLEQRPASGWERIEAESLVAALRARESEARRELETAELDFKKGLNLELDTPVRVSGQLETRPVDIDIDKAIVWATELRPELQAETYRAQMDAIGVNLAASRRIPSLVLGGDYEVTGQRFPLKQNNWDVTLGLKIPFSYDFWTEIRAKRAEQRQGQIKRAELHDKVRLEVRQAWDDLQFWQKEWPKREQEYLRLKTLFQAAQGQPGTLSALRAQTAFLDVEQRYLTAVESHLLARSRLERAIGRPLE